MLEPTLARVGLVALIASLFVAVDAPRPALACNDVAPYCDPVDGTIHDGSGNGAVAQVPGDPSPTAAGVWLGHNASARYCYANYNQFLIDADRDWLDDNCEFQLARAFAPALAMNPLDGCAGGEPFWSAKYIDEQGFGWGEFVRLAYMPAYYRDCGDYGHLGDSEFIMISVHYNGATQHWEVRDAYLSAHAGTPTNSSEYIRRREDLQYPTRYLAYPRVWVARAKHANYRSQGACNSGAIGFDTCEGNVTMGQMRVYRHRNTGSRFLDRFPTGVMSENFLYRNNFRVEYFYTQRNFRGWQPTSPPGVTPYANFLHSQVYECFDYTYTFQGNTCYWGQGPNPPTFRRLTGVIDGPQQATEGQTYTWSTFVTGGTLPYQAQWWRKYSSEPDFVLLGTSSGSTFSGGSQTITVDRCANLTLRMKVTSSDGQYWYDDHAVSVTCPPPPLTVYIDGPGVILAKATYTYTAVVSGASGASYQWAERFCDDAAGSVCSPWVTVTGLGATFNRTLNRDCSGTGEKNFMVRVEVAGGGRSATAEHTSQLCQAALA